MSWDIDIIAVYEEEIDPDLLVPDIFYRSGETLDLEAATSVNLGPKMAVVQSEGWTFVYDTYTRLFGDPEYLASISAKREIWIFRISEFGRLARWEKGKCKSDTDMIGDIEADLNKMMPTPAPGDPETIMQAYFELVTGTKFPAQGEYIEYTF